MKSSSAILKLFLVVLALALAHVLVSLGIGARREIASRNVLLAEADGADTITIRHANGETVAITNAARWSIVKPVRSEADSKKIAAIKDALAFVPIDETLSVPELAKLGRTFADFGLEEPRLTVEVSTGNVSGGVEFGDEIPGGDGVYARSNGGDFVFAVPKRVYEAVDMNLQDLRRRNLFSLSEEDVVAVDLRLEAGKFTRIEAGSANNDRFKAFLGRLLSAEVHDFVWPVAGSEEVRMAGMSLLAGYGLDPDSAESVTIHSVDESDRSISFGKAAGDGLVYALAFGGGAIVTVDADLKRDLDEGGETFTDMRLFPMEAGEVASITISDGGVSYLLHRDDDGAWHLESPVSAPANQKWVEAAVGRIVELKTSDEERGGIMVSAGTNRPPVEVSRVAVFGEDGVEKLRSLEIVKMQSSEVKRLVSGDDSVVFNPERKVWMFEQSVGNRRVNEEAVQGVLSVLSGFTAEQVVKLKVSETDLGVYGLDEPDFRLAVDSNVAGVARKNILIGARTVGGRYATLGAADAVFAVSDADVEKLTTSLAEQ